MVRLIPPLTLSRSKKPELFLDEGAAVGGVGLTSVTVGATTAMGDPAATKYEIESKETSKCKVFWCKFHFRLSKCLPAMYSHGCTNCSSGCSQSSGEGCSCDGGIVDTY